MVLLTFLLHFVSSRKSWPTAQKTWHCLDLLSSPLFLQRSHTTPANSRGKKANKVAYFPRYPLQKGPPFLVIMADSEALLPTKGYRNQWCNFRKCWHSEKITVSYPKPYEVLVSTLHDLARPDPWASSLTAEMHNTQQANSDISWKKMY